jgi:hypothetical protein
MYCVPAIFYRIIRSSREMFRDFSPLVAEFCMKISQNTIFFLRPIALFDIRLKMVVIPLTALFPRSVHKALGDKGPIHCPILYNKMHQLRILSLCP